MQALWNWMQTNLSPRNFYRTAAQFQPWLLGSGLLLLIVGVLWGLLFAPADYQQGNSFRIIYIHVPAASVAMTSYAAMAVCALMAFIWKLKVMESVGKSIAPVGAWFTLLALLTGSLWGKPTWGTYWVWDARLTSMLLLLFLYMGVLALHAAYEDAGRGARAAGVLAIVGVVNLPIIKYSVDWWNSLHQSSTFRMGARPSMPPEMWLPLLLTILGVYLLAAAMVIMRARNEIVWRERRTRWVAELLSGEKS